MIRTEPHTRERTVDVSSRALARICPERGLPVSTRASGVLGRSWTRARVRGRLVWTRWRFRLGDLQGVRCLWVRCRLRAKLAWMRLRHRGRLS